MTTYTLNPDTGMVEADGVPVESNFEIHGYCTCFPEQIGFTKDCGILAHRVEGHKQKETETPILMPIKTDVGYQELMYQRLTLLLHDDGSVTWDKESYKYGEF